MRRDSDTTIIERNFSTGKRRTFSFAPYCVAIIVLVLLGRMLVVLGTADRARRVNDAKSKYSPVVTESVVITPPPRQAVPVKFQNIIFRVGDWEIFRFTYEEGDGVREGEHE